MDRESKRSAVRRGLQLISLAGGTAIVALVGGEPTTPLGWASFAGGVGLLLASEVPTILSARSLALATAQVESDLTMTLGAAITPIAYLLSSMAEAPEEDRPGFQKQLIEKVVQAAANLCGPPDQTRAAFFELKEGTLSRVTWAGREEGPRKTFASNDPDTEHIYAQVKHHGLVLVEDIDKMDQSLPVNRSAKYKTFLSSAICSETHALGLLTVDALVPGTLDKLDVSRVRAPGALLAAGLTDQSAATLGSPGPLEEASGI